MTLPPFTFQCRACGACCRDNREIVLNPQDVFNLSRRFGIPTGQFIARHCEYDPAAGYGSFPLLTLATPGGNCVFLDGNLCSVHTLRPACCRNYPVGTIFQSNGAARHMLMEPAPGCSGFESGEEHSLESWRAGAGLDALEPGTSLIRDAFIIAMQSPPNADLRDTLYRILYDFDPLPGPSEPAPAHGSAAAMEVLRRRLDALRP